MDAIGPGVSGADGWRGPRGLDIGEFSDPFGIKRIMDVCTYPGDGVLPAIEIFAVLRAGIDGNAEGVEARFEWHAFAEI